MFAPETFQALVNRVFSEVSNMLVEKNRAYGNSAFAPARIFSKSSPIEQLLVRIDDKLSRIQTMDPACSEEDTVLDLIGYLVLLRIAQITANGDD